MTELPLQGSDFAEISLPISGFIIILCFYASMIDVERFCFLFPGKSCYGSSLPFYAALLHQLSKSEVQSGEAAEKPYVKPLL